MKKIMVGILSVLLFSTVLYAKKISGIIMPETLKACSGNLVLNGAGVRDKFFMDLYVGGLYLKSKSSNSSSIMNSDQPMAIRLHIVSKLITGEKMSKATNEGFEKSAGSNLPSLKTRIKKFISVFKSGIKKFDKYNFIYIPKKGTQVFKNGKLKTTIKGLDFKKALFGIWIGRKPAQKDLRNDMLGK